MQQIRRRGIAMKQFHVGLATFLLLSPCLLQGAEPARSLAGDTSPVSGKSRVWKSEVLDLQGKNGTLVQQRLVLEFAPTQPSDRTDAPDARVKLLTESAPYPGATSSFGDGSFRDVRFQEKDGTRTITITRSSETLSRTGPKTQRILNQYWSVSFTYDLIGDTLVLRGFPKTATTWGVSAFVVPKEDVIFKLSN
jgi:hypothetical protein